MSTPFDEQELISYIADRSTARSEDIRAVLKHENDYINKAHEGEGDEVDIDSDDLVDYILGRPNIQLDELTVETILELEMDYLMDKGLASYSD